MDFRKQVFLAYSSESFCNWGLRGLRSQDPSASRHLPQQSGTYLRNTYRLAAPNGLLDVQMKAFPGIHQILSTCVTHDVCLLRHLSSRASVLLATKTRLACNSKWFGELCHEDEELGVHWQAHGHEEVGVQQRIERQALASSPL